jgi:hypothetical protein
LGDFGFGDWVPGKSNPIRGLNRDQIFPDLRFGEWEGKRERVEVTDCASPVPATWHEAKQTIKTCLY